MCLDLGFPVVLSEIFAERISSHVGQISPDKDVNCRYTTAAFTLSPEILGLRHVVLTYPETGTLYAVPVRRLIALPEASSRRSLTVPPLPSASFWANDLNTLTGFTHRGLSPHKFTPMPGVHKMLQWSMGPPIFRRFVQGFDFIFFSKFSVAPCPLSLPLGRFKRINS